MQNYELAVLIKPLLPEDIQEKVIPAIQKIVTGLKGTAETKGEFSKKHLAYNVEGHEEGYYVFFKVSLEGENVQKLEKGLKSINDVLRFLVIREDQL